MYRITLLKKSFSLYKPKVIVSSFPLQFVNSCEMYKHSICPFSGASAIETIEDDKNVGKFYKYLNFPFSKQPMCYLKLSKYKLTALVCMTTAVGYVMAPGDFQALTFLSCITGTALASASAAAFNQYIEIPSDANMSRTANRPLVKKLLSPIHAFVFASCTGALGVTILYIGVNTLTATLGLTNILLVGSVVGAIPPVMGWAAATGNITAPGCLLLAGILYSWQFPHFNALSWNNKNDYAKTGYKMMAGENPNLCRRVAFRHALSTSVITSLVPLSNMTNIYFPLIMLIPNALFSYYGYNFYKRGDSKSARQLFRLSLIHLPICLIALIITKNWSPESLLNLENIIYLFTIKS